MKHEFKLIDGRIYLITEISIWDGVIEKTDVTDQMMSIVDKYLDHNQLSNNHKRINGVVYL